MNMSPPRAQIAMNHMTLPPRLNQPAKPPPLAGTAAAAAPGVTVGGGCGVGVSSVSGFSFGRAAGFGSAGGVDVPVVAGGGVCAVAGCVAAGGVCSGAVCAGGVCAGGV